MQHALADGKVERQYRAVALGRPVEVGASQTIRMRIARDSRDERKRQALPENAPGGQPASTQLVGLARGSLDGVELTALTVTLDTGRTHQIRVHLAALGCPLVGDKLYGGPAYPRLALHAERLRFPHPVSGRAIALEAPVPAEIAALHQ